MAKERPLSLHVPTSLAIWKTLQCVGDFDFEMLEELIATLLQYTPLASPLVRVGILSFFH